MSPAIVPFLHRWKHKPGLYPDPVHRLTIRSHLPFSGSIEIYQAVVRTHLCPASGSTNPDVLKYALLYLHVGIPMIPPMAVVVIVRNALQGMRHTLAPLICSAIELVCKAVFSFKLVPALGYPAVCACEPVAWMLCMIFILAAAYAFKNDLQDVWEERI